MNARSTKAWGEPYQLQGYHGAVYHGRARDGIAVIAVTTLAGDHLTTHHVFDIESMTCLGIGFCAKAGQDFADDVRQAFPHPLSLDGAEYLADIAKILSLRSTHGLVSKPQADAWIANGGRWLEDKEGAA